MNKESAYLWTLILSLLFSLGCSREEKRKVPDVSTIPVDIEIRRFDQSLFQLDTNQMESSLQQLQQQYPVFSDIFLNQLLGANDERIAPQGPEAYVKGFIQHPPLRELYDNTQAAYPDMSEFETAFEQAFQFYKYYFPEAPIPSITTFISEYSVAAFIYGNNDLATGLDYFLGSSHPYRQFDPQNPAFSEYMTRTYNPEHLVSKTLQPLIDDLIPPSSNNRLLDFMIHNGKKLYILDHILPYTPDSIKLEITTDQVDWLKANEGMIWSYLIKEKLLYNSEWVTIRKLVDYSPNSPGMPEEAPGRTANWIGWQIIKAYIKQHPEVDMEDLLQITDAQMILDGAKYKPRR